jgi:hypothetical protein
VVLYVYARSVQIDVKGESALRKKIYLFTSITAFIASLVQVIPHLLEHRLHYIPLFFQQMFASHGAAFVSIDILTTLLIFWLFAWFEARKLGMQHYWIYIVSCFLIGLFFAFPLFLYMRERALERTKKNAPVPQRSS